MAIFTTSKHDLDILLTNILAQRTTRRYSIEARNNALERANLKICSQANFSFLETEAIVSIVANNNEFTLPDNFERIDTKKQSLYLNSKEVENIVDYSRDRKNFNYSSIGKPVSWYQVGNKGILNCKPDTSYTGVLEYFKKPSLLSEEILIPSTYSGIIAWWGAMELLSPTNPSRPAVESECINQLNELINSDIVQSAENDQEYISI